YTVEQLATFPVPSVEELWQYNRAVRQETLAYLKGLSPDDFDVMPPSDHPRRRGYTIGRMFGHLLCEIGQHLGHVRYIRGLQRGLNQ
ncbi:MAG: DinB family protein, partial [Dehalococcoidia bacterium]